MFCISLSVISIGNISQMPCKFYGTPRLCLDDGSFFFYQHTFLIHVYDIPYLARWGHGMWEQTFNICFLYQRSVFLHLRYFYGIHLGYIWMVTTGVLFLLCVCKTGCMKFGVIYICWILEKACFISSNLAIRML